jgi:hypothetical protein
MRERDRDESQKDVGQEFACPTKHESLTTNDKSTLGHARLYKPVKKENQRDPKSHPGRQRAQEF